MSKTFILDFLTQHKKELHEKYGVINIGLFGSYARDEQREDSDIDEEMDFTVTKALIDK